MPTATETVKGLTETVKALIDDAANYKKEAKSIWEEMEETEDDGDRTFYKKFGEKVTSSISLSEKIKDKIVKAKVHIEHILEDQSANSGRKKGVDYSNQENTLPILARALRGLQTLVRDHGVALEFLRELFLQQDEKISLVEAKVLHPGEESLQRVAARFDLSGDPLHLSQAISCRHTQLKQQALLQYKNIHVEDSFI